MGTARGWRRRYGVAALTSVVMLSFLVGALAALNLTLGWTPWDAYAPGGSAERGPDLPGSAPNERPTLQLGSPVLASGEVAEVPLMVQNIPPPGLASYNLQIGFDRDVIRVQEVLPGDQPWTDNSIVISNRRGLVMLSNTKAEASSGNFLLAKLKVEAVGEAQQSADVKLEMATFRGPSRDQLPVSLVGGRIQIAGPPPNPLAESPAGEPESDGPEPPPAGPESGPADSPPAPVSWLQVMGDKIVDQSGHTVVFRGVNIENREWIWHSDRSIGFEMRAVTEATAAPPEGWGANIIILAVASGPINRNNTTYLGHLDQLVEEAKSNGAYTLLVYRYSEPNGSQPPMPDQAAEEAMAILASRYADEPAVLYGLQAEPHDVTWGQLQPRFTSMVDAIRSQNPRALIVVPGTDWGRYVYWALSDPVPRRNLVYKVHYYDSFAAAESGYKLSEVAGQYPLLLGEFGTGARMELGDVQQLLDLAESLGMSWAGWLFHDKACPCMLSNSDNFSPTPFGKEIRERLQANTIERPSPVTGLESMPAAAPSPSTREQSEGDMKVSISPPSAQVSPGEAVHFSAAVAGAPDQRVTWSVDAPAPGAFTLVDPFLWQGIHAATIADGAATTVWWDPDLWDARTDSANNAVSGKGSGNHIDIHPGPPDLSSGQRLNDRYVLGGDGSPGVGVMHLDFEGIINARVRNPMIIGAQQPGVVEFHAPAFITTGHWWEVAISPASQVLGGDFSAVPSPGDEFTGLQGSGHSPPEDSINFIIIGRNDVPCKNGWEFRIGVNKAMAHQTQEYAGPLYPMDPAEKDKLYHWQLTYYPDRIEARADLDEDGALELLDTFPVPVPWPEVYVHLLGVAYQADKHPQDGDCGAYQGQVRELTWKDVRVSPLKYARTAAFPKGGPGWLGYDLRDTQRFGEVLGVPQPNQEPFSKHSSLSFCSDDNVHGCDLAEPEKELTFDLPPWASQEIAHAQLVYDTRGDGAAVLEVNGVQIGEMPRAPSVPAASQDQWVRRSIPVPPVALVPGLNRVRLVMTGNVQMDRLEMELGYGTGDVGSNLGRISPEGVYQAPEGGTQAMAVQVRATSVTDPSVSATALLTVTPALESAPPADRPEDIAPPEGPAPAEEPAPTIEPPQPPEMAPTGPGAPLLPVSTPTPGPPPKLEWGIKNLIWPWLTLTTAALGLLALAAGGGFWIRHIRRQR